MGILGIVRRLAFQAPTAVRRLAFGARVGVVPALLVRSYRVPPAPAALRFPPSFHTYPGPDPKKWAEVLVSAFRRAWEAHGNEPTIFDELMERSEDLKKMFENAAEEVIEGLRASKNKYAEFQKDEPVLGLVVTSLAGYLMNQALKAGGKYTFSAAQVMSNPGEFKGTVMSVMEGQFVVLSEDRSFHRKENLLFEISKILTQANVQITHVHMNVQVGGATEAGLTNLTVKTVEMVKKAQQQEDVKKAQAQQQQEEKQEEGEKKAQQQQEEKQEEGEKKAQQQEEEKQEEGEQQEEEEEEEAKKARALQEEKKDEEEKEVEEVKK